MREIKFKVWSKSRNMYIIDGMTPKEIQVDACQSLELPMLTDEDCAWYQFTGLTTADGLDLYEGDICIPEDLQGMSHLGISSVWEYPIEFTDGSFMYNRQCLKDLKSPHGNKKTTLVRVREAHG